MPRAEVITLYDEQVAGCPECDGELWYIHVDGKTQSLLGITALECANPECGYKAVKKDEEKTDLHRMD